MNREAMAVEVGVVHITTPEGKLFVPYIRGSDDDAHMLIRTEDDYILLTQAKEGTGERSWVPVSKITPEGWLAEEHLFTSEAAAEQKRSEWEIEIIGGMN